MLDTYQALILKGIADASENQPERPEILEAELQQEISGHDDSPDADEFQIHQCTEVVDATTSERSEGHLPSVDSLSQARTSSRFAYLDALEIGSSFHS